MFTTLIIILQHLTSQHKHKNSVALPVIFKNEFIICTIVSFHILFGKYSLLVVKRAKFQNDVLY